MSAAATAAGYLYASGRLRGRGAREQEEAVKPRKEHKQPREPREEVVVAALPPRSEAPKRAPRIQYRVRRWRPEQGSGE